MCVGSLLLLRKLTSSSSACGQQSKVYNHERMHHIFFPESMTVTRAKSLLNGPLRVDGGSRDELGEQRQQEKHPQVL